MSKVAIAVIGFLTGAAVGAAAVFRYSEKKYRKIADEELEDARRVFREHKNTVRNEAKETSESLVEQVKSEQTRKADVKESEKRNDISASSGYADNLPYVISEDEAKNTVPLILYTDNIVVDASGQPVDDADDLVGWDNIDSLGDEDGETIYIRNPEKGIDYAVTYDERRYYD